MNDRKGLAKKIYMSPVSFWHTKQFCHIFTPVDQLLCSILHKNGPTTYNEHFTAYNIMTLVCVGWLHKVQWVLCSAFWSMDMTGGYACLFEAVCDVTTVRSTLKKTETGRGRAAQKTVSTSGDPAVRAERRRVKVPALEQEPTGTDNEIGSDLKSSHVDFKRNIFHRGKN